MDGRSDTSNIERIIDDIKMEWEISEDDVQPILDIDIKEDYSDRIFPVMEPKFCGVSTVIPNCNDAEEQTTVNTLIKQEFEEEELVLRDRPLSSNDMDPSSLAHNEVSDLMLPVMAINVCGVSTVIPNCNGAEEEATVNTLIKLEEELVLRDRPLSSNDMDPSSLAHNEVSGKFNNEIQPHGCDVSAILNHCYGTEEDAKGFKAMPKKEENVEEETIILQNRPLSSNDKDQTTQVQNANSVHKKNCVGYNKSYQVGDCDKSFSYKKKLVVHTRVHTGSKPYHCGYCEKSCSQKQSLVRHTSVHTGYKPYQCGRCEQSFPCKDKLVAHTRLHTGIKPYQCGHCEKSFSRKDKLVDHFKGSKPYTCEHCGKSFLRKDYLVVHTRLHTGSKPYQCGHCEKSFSQKQNLVIHTRVHTGSKPHQCGYCEKSFSRKLSLDYHTRLHTGF